MHFSYIHSFHQVFDQKRPNFFQVQTGPFEELPVSLPSRLLHIGFWVKSPSWTSPASICSPNGLFARPLGVRGPATLPNGTAAGRKRRHWCVCGHWASVMMDLLCSQSGSFRRQRPGNRDLMMTPGQFLVRRSGPGEPAGTANGYRRDAVAGTPTICSLIRQTAHSGQCVLVSHPRAFPERPGHTPSSCSGGEQQARRRIRCTGWLETEPLPMSSRNAGAVTSPFPGAPSLSLRLLTQGLGANEPGQDRGLRQPFGEKGEHSESEGAGRPSSQFKSRHLVNDNYRLVGGAACRPVQGLQATHPATKIAGPSATSAGVLRTAPARKFTFTRNLAGNPG